MYASDWGFAVINAAFPGKVNFGADPYTGEVGTTVATVDDSTLGAFLGTSQISIEFDLGSWVPIASLGPGVTTLLSGSYQTYDADGYGLSALSKVSQPVHRATTRAATGSTTRSTTSGPIAVSFSYGSGKVVYTSFHQHAQSQGVTRALMEYLAVY